MGRDICASSQGIQRRANEPRRRALPLPSGTEGGMSKTRKVRLHMRTQPELDAYFDGFSAAARMDAKTVSIFLAIPVVRSAAGWSDRVRGAWRCLFSKPRERML